MRNRWQVLAILFALVLLMQTTGVGYMTHPRNQGQGLAREAAPFHPAGLLPAASSDSTTLYDEQLGLTFTQDFTSLSYSVNAVEQSDPASGTGPAYLVNGLANNSYWFQVGLSYDWVPGYGFRMNYEVFNSSGSSIFPTGGGAGLLSFSGTVNEGDLVNLQLYFSGGSVVMAAQDQNTGASASESYSAGGSTYFQGNQFSPGNSQGFFTGLMTEWYHDSAYYGGEERVVYSQSVALTSGWMWIDEYEVPGKTDVFSACANYCLYPTSWSNPTQLQSFSSNGATEYSDAYEFQTGTATPTMVLTLSYSIVGGGSAYSPPTLSYFLDGVPQTTNLSPSPTQYAVDAGSQWSVATTLSGTTGTERWQTLQSGTGIANSAQTIDFVYYHQFLVSFALNVEGGGSGYGTPTVSFMSFGSSQTASGVFEVWADAGSYYSYSNPLPGSSSIERWYAGPTVSGVIETAFTVYATYYHQYDVSISYGLVGGGNPSPPVITATSLGQTSTGPLTGLQPNQVTSGWLDAYSSIQSSNTLAGSSGSERWYSPGTTNETVVSPTSISLVYYHQFAVTASYSTKGGGAPSRPSLNGTQSGLPFSVEMGLQTGSAWLDASTGWSVVGTLGGSSSQERWQTNSTTSGSVTGAMNFSLVYYHQFALTLSYSVIGGGNPSSPSMNGYQFGKALSIPMNGRPSAYFLDAGSNWTVPRVLGGSSSDERWATIQANGTVTGQSTIAIGYNHQYYVNTNLVPPSGGHSTNSSGWYNSGLTVQIMVTANNGWKFGGWTGSGIGAYSGSLNRSTIQVNGPLVENATLYPGLKVTAGDNGEVNYRYGSQSGTVPAGASVTVYAPLGTIISLSADPSSFLYKFDVWVPASTGSSSQVNLGLDSPMTAQAGFSINVIVVLGILVVVIVAIAVVSIVALMRRPKRHDAVP